MNVTGYDPFLYRSGATRLAQDFWGKAQLPRFKKHNQQKNFASLLQAKTQTVASKIKPDSWKIPSSVFRLTPSRREIQKEIQESPDKKKLYEASIQFEAYFIEQMFREMKKNIPKNSFLHGGQAEEWFQEMLLTERVSKIAEKTELGLAEQIYDSLRRI